jgi:hypothetical protein
VDQPLSYKPKITGLLHHCKIKISQPELQKKKNQSAQYHNPFKGKWLTGMAHYSPFAFSVNKKSIVKTLYFTGK